MELRQLRAFVVAAEKLSFTVAAKELAVSQPAVSQHVAALEKELKHALFRRRGRNIVLTDEGRRLYGYVRQALDLLHEASVVGHAASKLQGTLRIACCTIPPESFLPQVLARFLVVHPDVHEQVMVSDSTGASRAVESGAADVGFVVMPPKTGSLHIRPIACQEFILVAAADHALAREQEISVTQLCDQPFILREPGSGSRNGIEHALQEVGLTPLELNVVLETNSNEALCGAVKEGSGIAFVSRATVQEDLAEGHLVTLPVRGIQPHAHIYLITSTQRIPSLVAREFLSILLGDQATSHP